MKHTCFLFAYLSLVAIAYAATTNLVVERFPFSVPDGARESEYVYGHVSEGSTSYCQLSGGYGVQFARVDGLGGALVGTQLVAPSNWLAAAGQTGCTTFYGLDIWGDYLQFGDTFSKQIWRVHKSTGELTLYISRDAVTNALGINTLNWTSANMTDRRDGAVIFYESGSRQIVRALATNDIATFISAQDLSNAFGYATIVGGMTIDANGMFYASSGTSGATRFVFRRDLTNGLEVVLPTAVISNLVKESSIIIQDIFYAPDGWIYVAVSRSQNMNNILRFHPANPAGTLEMVLDKDQLAATVSGNQVSSFDWNKGLTWHTHQLRKGIYSYFTDLQPLLVISGDAEVPEYSTNVPYTCFFRLTNHYDALVQFDHTSTATWSIVGRPPDGVTLVGNLLSVEALLSNTVITLEAASTFGTLSATGRYDVVLVPEPALVWLVLLVALLAPGVRSA